MKVVGHRQRGVMGQCLHFGANTLNRSCKVGQLPVWQASRSTWRPFCGKQRPKRKIHSITFLRHGLNNMCSKCRENLTKFEGGDTIWWFSLKPEVAKIQDGGKWHHRMFRTLLDQPIPTTPHLWKFDERVKIYSNECISNFDLMVALGASTFSPQNRWDGYWYTPEGVCQIS